MLLVSLQRTMVLLLLLGKIGGFRARRASWLPANKDKLAFRLSLMGGDREERKKAGFCATILSRARGHLLALFLNTCTGIRNSFNIRYLRTRRSEADIKPYRPCLSANLCVVDECLYQLYAAESSSFNVVVMTGLISWPKIRHTGRTKQI